MKICDCCTRVYEGYCIYCSENDKNGNKQEVTDMDTEHKDTKK